MDLHRQTYGSFSASKSLNSFCRPLFLSLLFPYFLFFFNLFPSFLLELNRDSLDLGSSGRRGSGDRDRDGEISIVGVISYCHVFQIEYFVRLMLHERQMLFLDLLKENCIIDFMLLFGLKEFKRLEILEGID